MNSYQNQGLMLMNKQRMLKVVNETVEVKVQAQAQVTRLNLGFEIQVWEKMLKVEGEIVIS